MSDLKIDLDSNDLLLVNGDLTIHSLKEDSIAQQLKIRLQFFKGEWFLNTGFGMPFYQRILTKQITKNEVDNIFREEILSVEGVDLINFFESSFDNLTREYSLSFEAVVDSGEIVSLTI